MSTVSSLSEPGNEVEIRLFAARARLVDPRADDLAPNAAAALREFPTDRLIGYGVDRSDALELEESVLSGADWRDAAISLADTCCAHADAAAPGHGDVSRVLYLRRASALLRIAQATMLMDTEDRCDLYRRAGRLYDAAAQLATDRLRVTLPTPAGPLIGWHLRTAQPPIGSALVLGGLEAYAMDFDSVGEALAARGIEALLLDGPGQGETRFVHHHYLTEQWCQAYSVALDYLASEAPDRPIAVVGNSMGGAFALALAATDRRIRACCSNGGVPAPAMVAQTAGPSFARMVGYSGATDTEQARRIWSTVKPLESGPNAGYPLLVLQGGGDERVTDDVARYLLRHAPTEDKHMVIFSDGDHCLYNHKTDRDIVIGDWVRSRLSVESSCAG